MSEDTGITYYRVKRDDTEDKISTLNISWQASAWASIWAISVVNISVIDALNTSEISYSDRVLVWNPRATSPHGFDRCRCGIRLNIGRHLAHLEDLQTLRTQIREDYGPPTRTYEGLVMK